MMAREREDSFQSWK